MRFVVYGAGAVGGTIGGSLFAHGFDVVLIARGGHFEAIRGMGSACSRPRDRRRCPYPSSNIRATSERPMTTSSC